MQTDPTRGPSDTNCVKKSKDLLADFWSLLIDRSLVRCSKDIINIRRHSFLQAAIDKTCVGVLPCTLPPFCHHLPLQPLPSPCLVATGRTGNHGLRYLLSPSFLRTPNLSYQRPATWGLALAHPHVRVGRPFLFPRHNHSSRRLLLLRAALSCMRFGWRVASWKLLLFGWRTRLQAVGSFIEPDSHNKQHKHRFLLPTGMMISHGPDRWLL